MNGLTYFVSVSHVWRRTAINGGFKNVSHVNKTQKLVCTLTLLDAGWDEKLATAKHQTLRGQRLLTSNTMLNHVSFHFLAADQS